MALVRFSMDVSHHGLRGANRCQQHAPPRGCFGWADLCSDWPLATVLQLHQEAAHMTPWIRKLHKWVGLIIALQFVMWTGSGLTMSLLDHARVEGKHHQTSHAH